MEIFEHNGRTFEIHIMKIGNRYDWYIVDDNNQTHKNMDEVARSEEQALAEAQFRARSL